MVPDITFTKYRGLYDPRAQGPFIKSWLDFTAWLSVFTVTSDKFTVPGFGAHTLRPGLITRSVDNTGLITSCIFDVDAGTPSDVAKCRAALIRDGLAAHFYTSHSHLTERPAYRLVIPVSRHLSRPAYSAVRRHLITAFAIPCKAEQSADASRFWFLPSCRPGAVGEAETLVGHAFEVDSIDLTIVPVARSAALLRADWVAPPEPPPGIPVDMAPLRAAIEGRITRFLRRKDPRAAPLRNLLAGAPLAGHGERNTVTLSVCGLIAYAAPKDTPLSALLAILRPSLNAMVAAGSKLDESKVERMLISALRKRAANTTDLKDFIAHHSAHKAALDVAIGFKPPPPHED